jgi:hypothetical protein
VAIAVPLTHQETRARPIPMKLEEHDGAMFGIGQRCRGRLFHTVLKTAGAG